RRCARRADVGGRGLPADPTIPRTHRSADPSRRTLGKRRGEERRRVAPAARSPPDQPRQCADLVQGTTGAGNKRGLCARPRIGEPGGSLLGAFAAFSLSLHPVKTRVIEFGRHAAVNRKKRGVSRPDTFAFLGFTFICFSTYHGLWVGHLSRGEPAPMREMAE